MKKKEQTDEIRNASSITDKEMIGLLVELSGSVFWPAIERFVAVRSIMAENALCSIDPFKNPTDMARNQGIRMGLADMLNFVKAEKLKMEKAGKGEGFDDTVPKY